jgi:hypothetical protein
MGEKCVTVAQAVECLLSTCEALGSNLSLTKKVWMHYLVSFAQSLWRNLYPKDMLWFTSILRFVMTPSHVSCFPGWTQLFLKFISALLTAAVRSSRKNTTSFSFIFFFLWDGDLNSKPHSCKAGTLTTWATRPVHMFWFFWRWDLVNYLCLGRPQTKFLPS